MLVAANLVPLAGVLFFGWSVFATLLLFWLENVMVGAFNVLRMLVAQPQIGAMWAAKLFMIPFFTFHYGMFVTVHGMFVLTLFGGGFVGRGFLTPTTFWHAVQAAGIAPAAWGLVLSHAVSFGFNYIGTGQYESALVPALMFRPYGPRDGAARRDPGRRLPRRYTRLTAHPARPARRPEDRLDLFGHLREHSGTVATPAPDLLGLV